jgi:hypothetical protein
VRSLLHSARAALPPVSSAPGTSSASADYVTLLRRRAGPCREQVGDRPRIHVQRSLTARHRPEGPSRERRTGVSRQQVLRHGAHIRSRTATAVPQRACRRPGLAANQDGRPRRTRRSRSASAPSRGSRSPTTATPEPPASSPRHLRPARYLPTSAATTDRPSLVAWMEAERPGATQDEHLAGTQSPPGE